MRTLLVLILLSFCSVLHTQTITSGPLSGHIRGTLLPNTTYIITDSIVVDAVDSLQISPGDTLIMQSVNGAMFIFGNFSCEGTSESPIVITCPADRRTLGPGQWGGIVIDSPNVFNMKFTHIYWAGGSDLSGHAYRTINIVSGYLHNTVTTFTDNWITGTVDDAIGITGGKVSLLRNVCKWCGSPDGDNLNIKKGVWGEIAYNVIWGAGGNGIKVNASSTTRITNVCIHNNTITSSGWRRLGEPGYCILVDASARAEIYNNVFGDSYNDLEITTAADTARVYYDNNFFFGSVDSLNAANIFWAPDGVARQQANDKFVGHTGHPFVKFSDYFTNDWNALDGENNYQLNGTYKNLGFTPPVSWTNPGMIGALPGDANVGALGATATGVNNESLNNPTTFALKQNYPNPFNPTTTIEYALPHTANVTLKVFNMLGQEVKTLTNGVESTGIHSVQFNAKNLTSGVYFYRLQTGSFSQVNRMLLLK
jgi:hypothetical protein